MRRFDIRPPIIFLNLGATELTAVRIVDDRRSPRLPNESLRRIDPEGQVGSRLHGFETPETLATSQIQDPPSSQPTTIGVQQRLEELMPTQPMPLVMVQLCSFGSPPRKFEGIMPILHPPQDLLSLRERHFLSLHSLNLLVRNDQQPCVFGIVVYVVERDCLDANIAEYCFHLVFRVVANIGHTIIFKVPAISLQ